VLPVEQGASASLATIAEAVASGADAVTSYMLLGHRDARSEAEEIGRNARLAWACERFGVLLMIEPRHVRERLRPESKAGPDVMSLYCHIAAEVGADLVKCIWGGSVSTMSDVATCPAPVLMAGGRKQEDPNQSLRLASDAAKAGCRGLVFGCNVFQAAEPGEMLRTLRERLSGECPTN
jgi:class I fructose-bisphosphate aldolase